MYVYIKVVYICMFTIKWFIHVCLQSSSLYMYVYNQVVYTCMFTVKWYIQVNITAFFLKENFLIIW